MGDAKRRVLAAFTKRGRVGVVLSTLRRHRAGPRSKFVYRVRGNGVRQVGVASRALASRPGVQRRHVRLA